MQELEELRAQIDEIESEKQNKGPKHTFTIASTTNINMKAELRLKIIATASTLWFGVSDASTIVLARITTIMVVLNHDDDA